MEIRAGSAAQLGAKWDGHGVNFAVFSTHATRVELCLFDADDPLRETRLALPERTQNIWHGYVAGISPGQIYGYRVEGPYSPSDGHRFNPNKLLVDPYAHALTGPMHWNEILCESADASRERDARDSASHAPRSVVVDTDFDWEGDQRPCTAWEDSLIYECHVKGLTALHPDVPEALRGKFLGLAAKPIVQHLHSLGVTAVELLPVHQAFSERHLVERGLANYWGYNSLGFFAPDYRFASDSLGKQVHEFKTMVKALHRAGIEVILDVVYNHTAEGDQSGPTLSWRGFDHANYYRLDPSDRTRNLDVTGCGNTVDTRKSPALRMVMDSLRYWVQEMHVDGFRFDLAPALARTYKGFDHESGFLQALAQDPVLSQVKLIAEPWDLGANGEQIGNFPSEWSEWNARYRDSLRRFWRGDVGELRHFASRLTGSSDLFAMSGRGPRASINYATSHDGFTLHDWASYTKKHNLKNGEDNRDGSDENFSHNWGHDGATHDPVVLNLRRKAVRNALTTLAFSVGVPMLTQGDEMGRTQDGNNNAYCQDNATSWVSWALDPAQRELLEFSRQLFALRRAHEAFRRRDFFSGRNFANRQGKDLTWLRSDGREFEHDDWFTTAQNALGMLLQIPPNPALQRATAQRREAPEYGARTDGKTPLRSSALLLLINGNDTPCEFHLPALDCNARWTVLVSTEERYIPQTQYAKTIHLDARCLLLLESGAC